jgi:GTPase SAR1 family protein
MTQLRTFRIALLGDPHVGKTSLVHRFTADQRPGWKAGAWVLPTTGIERTSKLLPGCCQPEVGEVDVLLQLFDFAGLADERSRIPVELLRGWDAVMVLFDAGAFETFAGALAWQQLLKGTSQDHENVSILVGNKMEEHNEIPSFLRHPLASPQLDQVCAEAGFQCWRLVSAHTNKGCDDLWDTVVQILLAMPDKPRSNG